MKIHPAKIFEEIQELKGTGSMTAKKKLIKDNLDVPEFFKTVRYALDPFKQFFLTTVPGLTDIKRGARKKAVMKRAGVRDIFDEAPTKLPWGEQFRTMFELLDKLSSRALPPQ
jgi:hypothetical protein